MRVSSKGTLVLSIALVAGLLLVVAGAQAIAPAGRVLLLPLVMAPQRLPPIAAKWVVGSTPDFSRCSA